nr:signal peptide peptidase SppA [bacterium]
NWLWKSGRLDLGWMHRPLHYLSVGAKLENAWTGDDEKTNLIAGFAMQNTTGKFGFGIDGRFDDFAAAESFSPILSATAFVEPLDGLRLSANVYDFENADIRLSAGFSFSKIGFGTQANPEQFDKSMYSLRFTENPYRTVVDKIFKPKEQKKYVRMELKGYFIEEPEVKKSKFNFNIPMPKIPFIGGGDEQRGRQLRKFIDEIDALTEDESVAGLIIDYKWVVAGMGKLADMRNALQRFHDSGKKIVVYSKFGLGNSSVFLLSMADEIYIHEQMGVDLKGIAVNMEFYRGLLDTLNIVPEVWRISPYKSAGDAFLNKKMSPEMHENLGQLVGSLYEQIVAGISEGKGWTIAETKEIIDAGPYELAEMAQEAGLITGTMYPDEFDEYVKKLDGDKTKIAKHGKTESEEEPYQYAWRDDIEKEKIAVIYAVGGIKPGKSQRGIGASTVMGDETIAKAIKQAREDKSVKAIVLRIDSGGGSALASDIIWREVLKTTETDSANVKPFIASMSDVAGSGGYYIACQADKIIAYPTTITGSIGVIGMRLNMSQLKERFGITTDGFHFGKNADFGAGHRLATEEENERILESINDIYDKFKERVVKGREQITDFDKLDEIALGRVWTGEDAIENGLIDEVGGYYDAIELAKAEGGIEGEVEIVEYPKRERKKGLEAKLGLGAEIENLPPELREIFELLEIIPVLESDRAQMIMPGKIEVK